MIFYVVFLQHSFKLLILLLYFFKKMLFLLVLNKNTVYIICILTTKKIKQMFTKEDVKSLLLVAAIVLGSYALFYIGAKYMVAYGAANCIIGCI